MNLKRIQHFRARWLCLALLLTLSACETVARREAPLLTSRDAVPAAFSREVMYVDDGRQEYDGDATRLLWKIRQSAHALARGKPSSFSPPGAPANCPAPAVVAVAKTN